ncbi:histone acetyltransferase KAT6B [Patella vulgata]|uniref:histone acetyltransferase KAT6B n=1 Tax=Patella vulgata TaxID=6465 RepID=UPI00218020CC|nr:histone acetyltransferase KAT6B [Patella vulgata]
MAPIKHKDWILSSIDQLRHRKARPDLNRICHMVRRRYGLSIQETTASLENLVDARIVVKVEYKGHTSYRNAAKWKKSAMGGQVLNSNAFIQDIQKAVAEICKNNSSGERGANIRDIETWLAANGSEETEKESANLEDALNREVENKRLKRLFFNGHYIIAKKNTEDKEKSRPKGAIATTSAKSTAENTNPTTVKKRGRPPSKRMKFKKTHGPDFEMLDLVGKKSKNIDAGFYDDDVNAVCDFCKLTSSKNIKGKPERLLFCHDCNAIAHPSCMKYSPKLAKKAYKGEWQCIDCKTCCVCDDAEAATIMLFCDWCDRGYHMTCHKPTLKDKPKGKWMCSDCGGASVSKVQEVEESSGSESICNDNYGSFPPTPCDSPVQCDDEKYRYKLYKKKQSSKESLARELSKDPKLDGQYYPDASDWTIDQVVQFFQSLGYSDQVECFKDQEIDGKSLLLMKRVDVLTGLSLKLGPALKIYQHIQGLQTAGLEF